MTSFLVNKNDEYITPQLLGQNLRSVIFYFIITSEIRNTATVMTEQ